MEIITITKSIPDVETGFYAPEIHNSANCRECKTNTCQYQIEMPWLKGGKGTLEVGEQYVVEYHYQHDGEDMFRLLQLPDKMLTVDLTDLQLEESTDFKADWYDND